jgi:glycerate kinase
MVLDLKIIVAPGAFKGSLTASEAAQAIAQGVRRVFPSAGTVLLPVADGGDGTLEALVEATGGAYRRAQVSGPLREPVEALWGVLGDKDTAVIETARVCGLVLVPPARRDPRTTTTRGVGQLLRHAMDGGYRRFIVGMGGSATNDGGAGAAQGLGLRLLDAGGHDLPPGGAALLRLARIDASRLDPRISQSQITAATDVSNPLCGPLGAALVYGPQKGATPEVAELLDQALAHLAGVIRSDLGMDVTEMPRGGAAGGLGAGLAAFLGAKLEPGAELVCRALGLEARLHGADLVIVGEGRLDAQTAFDKAPAVVARHAAARGIPVLAVAGSLGPGHEALRQHGITHMAAVVSANVTLEHAMSDAARLLAEATERALREHGLATKTS